MHILKSNKFRLFLWTAIICGSFFYNCYQEQQLVTWHAKNNALAYLSKDMLYGMWSARHGGTYVPITADTPPDPFLAHVKERDIVTPSGKQLTLVNPMYMSRQTNELSKTMGTDMYAHLTSLRPIRPENAADTWETQALLAFEKGVPEVGEVVAIENQSYFRLMRPLYVSQECLQCHAQQGYKIGDVRGGINVNVKMGPIQSVGNLTIRRFLLLHGIAWCLGIIFAIVFQRTYSKKEKEIKSINEKLQEKDQEMQTQVENLQQAQALLKIKYSPNVDQQPSKLSSIGLLAKRVDSEVPKKVC